MSWFLQIHVGWLLTVHSKRFIIRRFVFIKDTNLYFLTMWVVHKGLHINNQKQNNQKWNIPCLKYGLRTTNPSKSLPQTLHSILDSLCCPLSLCRMSWLPLATERNIIMSYGAHTVGSHWCSKTMILSQWINISSWRQSKREIKKNDLTINKFMPHWLLILFIIQKKQSKKFTQK